MSCNSGIYCIQNKANGKIYIGSSVDLHSRKYEHFYKLNNNKHENIYLQRSFCKYGSEFFLFKVIEYIPDFEKLIEREQYFLNIHWDNQKKCYNILPQAGSLLGYKHNKEAKEKMSNKLIGNKRWLGKHHSEETKQKISNALKMRKRTEEHILKIKEARKISIKVYRVTNNEFIGEFETITDCCKELGLNKCHVSNVLSAKRKQHKGYYFKKSSRGVVE